MPGRSLIRHRAVFCRVPTPPALLFRLLLLRWLCFVPDLTSDGTLLSLYRGGGRGLQVRPYQVQTVESADLATRPTPHLPPPVLELRPQRWPRCDCGFWLSSVTEFHRLRGKQGRGGGDVAVQPPVSGAAAAIVALSIRNTACSRGQSRALPLPSLTAAMAAPIMRSIPSTAAVASTSPRCHQCVFATERAITINRSCATLDPTIGRVMKRERRGVRVEEGGERPWVKPSFTLYCSQI
ncbi:hypothetical protein Taro_003986 [Colocasia esculenta]|uniref:Uncharacterized protein n=1 Tax=Colocasia esculenta TaxID=4460 RepID=A0A843TNU5_COLES|nr:hypothetical protein [Colocasia esculenta]